MPGTQPHISFTAFPDRQSASAVTADLLAVSLRNDLDHGSEGSLVLSGGTTPGDTFRQLSQAALDWPRVTVLPSDERWVAPDDASSNERLIRETLLQGEASAARLLPLYRCGLEPAQAPPAVEQDLDALSRPFSGVLLGMGADGHFASLFPDFAELTQALDSESGHRCVLVRTAGSPFVRISLTLPALLQTRTLVLLFFGEEKRAVFDAAAGGDERLPVAALLAQETVPVSVHWAP